MPPRIAVVIGVVKNVQNVCVKEACVAVWALNCKREHFSEQESFVDSMHTCLSNYGLQLVKKNDVVNER